MNSSTENLKRYNWVDFGRGIAVLLVIMIHTSHSFSNSDFLKNFTNAGAMGVQLFFILSAFTLFNSFKQRYEKDGEKRIKLFFLRRFFRIAPLYYFFALFYTLVEIALKGIHTIEYWKILMCVMFLNGIFVPVINYIPPGGWSIGTEVLFYCLVPFLFKKIKTTKHAVYLLLFSILLSNIINYIVQAIVYLLKISDNDLSKRLYTYQWLPNQLPVFCCGILLFYIFNSVHFSKEIRKIFLTLSICIFILLSQIHLSLNYLYYTFQSPYLYSIAFCFFIIGIKNYEFNNGLSNLFCLIGKYSFSMYLLHFFILRIFSIAFSYTGFERQSDLTFLLSYIFVTAITFFFSSILYKYEIKGIAFGNLQIKKISKV
ncbi:acyltransferase family protein [Flavobacterium anhuiense]|uniref:acyltransferase family protein n=1 Tax=Flavobacterium anhuiense TaxID=459526 RepID=UPI003D96F8EE